ncbi:unnamed protein product [Prorocentrum cordatum]|uniref:Uncharacterized protein n=1 Tax=Prorocentrum cordatum TaxID=2364126 RepID=A0ABN9QTZ1_9DINO|nr:unnamed protein product [Polarella glacialis]
MSEAKARSLRGGGVQLRQGAGSVFQGVDILLPMRQIVGQGVRGQVQLAHGGDELPGDMHLGFLFAPRRRLPVGLRDEKLPKVTFLTALFSPAALGIVFGTLAANTPRRF